jgi:L-threonylcarbamoyladenylate synthase
MTLILPRNEIAKDFITGGQNNVGLRVPSQPIALALLNKFSDMGGQGIAAPSANRFGAVSPTTAKAVTRELGNYLERDDLVLDGGRCLIGIESTILDCTQFIPRILRQGAITEEIIEQIIGTKIQVDMGSSQIKSPGSLKSHYSPKAKLILNGLPKSGEGFVALSNIKTPNGAIRLSSPENIEQYAKELYSALRYGDAIGLTTIYAQIPPNVGIGKAIIDRLYKASAKSYL